jgi:uroporphyrinogen-III synthase
MARVLITRPEEDAAPLAEALAARGHRVLIEPLLRIERADPPPALDGAAQALLFTSANGVRAFAALSSDRRTPACCVGDATARAARDAGFATVLSAGGDVASLAALAAARLRPENGPLLHVAGSVVAGDLAGALEAVGFTVRRAVAYRAETAAALTPPTRAALAAGEVDAVLLFSPRTARTFARLVREASLETTLARVSFLCLSRAVADALAPLPHGRLLVAAEPTQEALIALL